MLRHDKTGENEQSGAAYKRDGPDICTDLRSKAQTPMNVTGEWNHKQTGYGYADGWDPMKLRIVPWGDQIRNHSVAPIVSLWGKDGGKGKRPK